MASVPDRRAGRADPAASRRAGRTQLGDSRIEQSASRARGNQREARTAIRGSYPGKSAREASKRFPDPAITGRRTRCRLSAGQDAGRSGRRTRQGTVGLGDHAQAVAPQGRHPEEAPVTGHGTARHGETVHRRADSCSGSGCISGPCCGRSSGKPDGGTEGHTRILRRASASAGRSRSAGCARRQPRARRRPWPVEGRAEDRGNAGQGHRSRPDGGNRHPKRRDCRPCQPQRSSRRQRNCHG